MADPAVQNPQQLERATLQKLQQYNHLLGESPPKDIPFWDIVVVTARDEEQRKSYEEQIELKKARAEIPGFVKYLVFSDPPGAKIGCGGATMYVLEELEANIPGEELEKAKVMLIHAGGYSQRLPHVSVLGKVFMALPCGNPMFHMFDALLMMYVDLPARMNPGVYTAASDVIFLYNGAGDWSFTDPGITAIGHPAPLEAARNHGVYVIEEGETLRQKYLKDPSCAATMGVVKQFLHKVTPQTMRKKGATIHNGDEVYVDLSYYMDHGTANKLCKFYQENKPLTCEIDAYGDFLQALGPDATSEYCGNTANVTLASEGLVEMRQKVYNLLKGTPFRVVIYHEAQFNHVGTTREYLHHLCYNQTLQRACQFQTEIMVNTSTMLSGGDDDQRPPSKRGKWSSFEDCALMHSVILNRDSISVGAGTVIEYCTLEEGIKVGRNCIISNLHVPAHTVIPDSSFLHCVAVESEGKVQYATFAFDTGNNMKAVQSMDNSSKLQYCQLSMDTAVKKLGYTSTTARLWPPECTTCSLWTAQLFPVFESRLESSCYAITMIRCLRGLQEPSECSSSTWISVADMLKSKSTAHLLAYHSELRATILKFTGN